MPAMGTTPVEEDFGEVDMAGAIPRGVAAGGRRQPLAVLDVAATLDAGQLAGLRLGILHGRLHPEEKDRVSGSSPRARSMSWSRPP